jgi:hypothetical protein
VLEEGRELRVVAIPDATSGDLRARVGADRFWNAIEWLDDEALAAEPPPPPPELPPVANGEHADDAVGNGAGPNGGETPAAAPPVPGIVGRVPVTWPLHKTVSPEEHEEQLQHCLELLVRAQIRHNSNEVWLSPFLKGAMTQYFGNLVHPERRALINELRSRGVIRVEERENLYADYPYSVIVVDESHPMTQAARLRIRGSGRVIPGLGRSAPEG